MKLRILRFLFFALEAGTIGGAIAFWQFPQMNSHGAGVVFDSLRWFVFVLFLLLPVVSVCLWWSERLLAEIGLGTFLVVGMLGLFLPVL